MRAAIFHEHGGPDELIPVQFGADNTYSSTIALEQPLFRAGAIVGLGAASRFETLQREVVRGQEQSRVGDLGEDRHYERLYLLGSFLLGERPYLQKLPDVKRIDMTVPDRIIVRRKSS